MNELRLQVISSKIFEILESSGMTGDEFFDKCLRQPIDVPVGIKDPDTGDIVLGFCNHKDIGLMFYLPEDLNFNKLQSNQTPSLPSKSDLRQQILLQESPEDRHPDNP